MSDKLQFIRDSILDVQATIRVTDTKIAVLIVILLAPLSNLGRISAHIDNFIIKFPSNWELLIVLLFVVSWGAAIVAAIRVISAIDNPAAHIINNDLCSGSYYSGGLYTPGITDVFTNREILKASKDVDSHLLTFPNNIEEIEKELVFEQMKLVYIRDIKFCRLSFSIQATYIWMVLGMFIYIYSKYF